jgi:hypothetical protein
LYRQRLAPGGVLVVEEVVAGVTDMQITYGTNGSDNIQGASAITTAGWANVNSIFIKLWADSADSNVSTDPTSNNGRIHKPFTYLITLRNRVK